jgi:hypothetical protein
MFSSESAVDLQVHLHVEDLYDILKILKISTEQNNVQIVKLFGYSEDMDTSQFTSSRKKCV